MFDKILSLVAPHYCSGCGNEGNILCDRCSTALPSLPPRCYRCHKLTGDSKTCKACRRTSRLFAVQARTAYDSLAKQTVWRLKFESARAGARDMAREMLPLLPTRGVALVPVPTATNRIRERGFDQTVLLCRELQRLSGLPVLPCLARLDQSEQVGATRRQRVKQLQGAYRVRHASLVRNRRLLLIDDVITTGATLEACALALHEAGARRVEAVVFAQA